MRFEIKDIFAVMTIVAILCVFSTADRKYDTWFMAALAVAFNASVWVKSH